MSYISGRPEEIESGLTRDGVVYLSNVDDEVRLLEIATSLGACVEPGVGMPAGIHDGRVYSVRTRGDGNGEVDRHGNLILSTTHLEFPLHTDAFNRGKPPHYVLLLRTDSSSSQTVSQVSDAWAALDELPEETIRNLSTEPYPSAEGGRPLLEPIGGVRRVRFNRREIENWAAQSDLDLPRAAAEALEAFGDALVARQHSFVIEPGDCLLLDNWRFCHGRSQMAADSERVLRRVWVE
jgi:alpha-ketoglutarate-dependent taurine dioxygenase